MVKGLRERTICFYRGRHSRRDDTGFTLMEFIVVAVIAGMLVAVVAPNMADFLKDNRLTAQANALTADLRFARSEAIKRQENITVCRANHSFVACDHATGAWNMGWIILDASGEVLRVRRELDYTHNLRGAVRGPDVVDALVYTSNGIPLSLETQSLQLCDQRGASHGKAIHVTATGHPRVGQAPPSDC